MWRAGSMTRRQKSASKDDDEKKKKRTSKQKNSEQPDLNQRPKDINFPTTVFRYYQLSYARFSISNEKIYYQQQLMAQCTSDESPVATNTQIQVWQY